MLPSGLNGHTQKIVLLVGVDPRTFFSTTKLWATRGRLGRFFHTAMIRHVMLLCVDDVNLDGQF